MTRQDSHHKMQQSAYKEGSMKGKVHCTRVVQDRGNTCCRQTWNRVHFNSSKNEWHILGVSGFKPLFGSYLLITNLSFKSKKLASLEINQSSYESTFFHVRLHQLQIPPCSNLQSVPRSCLQIKHSTVCLCHNIGPSFCLILFWLHIYLVNFLFQAENLPLLTKGAMEDQTIAWVGGMSPAQLCVTPGSVCLLFFWQCF